MKAENGDIYGMAAKATMWRISNNNGAKYQAGETGSMPARNSNQYRVISYRNSIIVTYHLISEEKAAYSGSRRA